MVTSHVEIVNESVVKNIKAENNKENRKLKGGELAWTISGLNCSTNRPMHVPCMWQSKE